MKAVTPEPTKKTLRERMLATTASLPTGKLSRVWKSGRAGAALARAISKGDDVDVEAVASAVLSLGNLKGIAMKAGQMVSVLTPTMNDEARKMVALLQTSASATPLSMVQATLRSSLGPSAEALIATLSPAPLAVASIGQVHTATLPDGRMVVVKVRHAGIRAALDAELDVAGAGASVGNVVVAAFGGGAITDFVDEARRGFLGECDYAVEAQHQRQFAGFFADDRDIVVPAVIEEFCADDVLVAEFRGGVSVDATGAGDRDRIGAALYRFFVGALYRHRLLHADPHPGNFAVDAFGRVVVYDFGCVREFADTDVRGLVALSRAVRDDDVAAMARGLRDLGGADVVDDADRATLRRLLRGFFAPITIAGPHAPVPDVDVDTRQTLRDKQAMHRLRLPGRLLFLFRLRFGLYAVLARLGSVVDWRALEQELTTT